MKVPIVMAEEFARKYNLAWCVVFGLDKDSNTYDGATFGVEPKDKDTAARMWKRIGSLIGTGWVGQRDDERAKNTLKWVLEEMKRIEKSSVFPVQPDRWDLLRERIDTAIGEP